MNENLNKDNLIRLIKRFDKRKIIVVGDLIIDEYLYGLTTRVSREAPVLILKHDKTEYKLGGAANAINNLHTLGASVFPIGVVGDDEAGKNLLEIFKKKGIAIDGVFRDKRVNTVTKTRIMAGGKNIIKQQVIRIDRENKKKIGIVTSKKILEILRSRIDETEGVIFSDYGYGVCKIPDLRYIMSDFHSRGGIFTVDSRFDLLRLKNLTVATPNESEIEELFGKKLNGDLAKLEKAGLKLLKKIASDFLLITRGSKGMLIIKSNGEVHHLPIVGSDEIVDVTGAGDTVISILTCALCAGGDPLESSQLANYGGGLVVMKSGTASVSPQELINAVKDNN
jgi:D-glycero-beta-D-manno-heptose-7-phosphate kinase